MKLTATHGAPRSRSLTWRCEQKSRVCVCARARVRDARRAVVPEVVLATNVVLEANRVLPVEGVPIDAADKADVVDIVLDLLLQVALLRKRVNDDTKDDVEQHDDHDHVEEQVDCPPNGRATRVVVDLIAIVCERLRDALVVEAKVHRVSEAHERRLAQVDAHVASLGRLLGASKRARSGLGWACAWV